jgi:hypothetical protein
MPARLAPLPQAVARKLYKTGQTRGATPAEIYQNRVGRNSTVLIPFSHWRACLKEDPDQYEKGYIVLISPPDYFDRQDAVRSSGLRLGENLLVFYTRREDWLKWEPGGMSWVEAGSRISPLGGQFVARVPGTTASTRTAAIQLGFTTTQSRGAGIRVYEYANADTTAASRLQLEALFWGCHDVEEVLKRAGMSAHEIESRRDHTLGAAGETGLLDSARLRQARTIDAAGLTVCPLCRAPMSAREFSDRVRQAEGRERLDNTVTEASLFHIRELRVGELGHHPYNLGWGHHHCNVVAKDAGIERTLDWMSEVLERNRGEKASDG